MSVRSRGAGDWDTKMNGTTSTRSESGPFIRIPDPDERWNKHRQTAHFVLPIGDSLREIHQCYMNAALVHQSGGGTGFNFSGIRARGSPVKSTDGVASGPVSFMWALNACTEVIKQGGRRRGANMGILNVTHPDILQFVTCKRVEGEFANFNISVMIPDWFMEKVKSGCRDHPVAVNDCGYVEVDGKPVLRVQTSLTTMGWNPCRVITVERVGRVVRNCRTESRGLLLTASPRQSICDECGFIKQPSCGEQRYFPRIVQPRSITSVIHHRVRLRESKTTFEWSA